MSLRTLPAASAAPDADQATSPSTRLDNAYCVSVAPAQSTSPRPTRTAALGAFPVWLVQTDGNGAERCRVLVQSAAPLYFAKGTGAHFYLVAPSGVASGTDVQYDVTIGDDPGDWLEAQAATSAGLVEQVRVVPAGTLIGSVGAGQGYTVLPAFTRPAGASEVELWFDQPSQPMNGGVVINQLTLSAIDSDGTETVVNATGPAFDNTVGGRRLVAKFGRAASGAAPSPAIAAQWKLGTDANIPLILTMAPPAGLRMFLATGNMNSTVRTALPFRARWS